jgi:hypothetical protein
VALGVLAFGASLPVRAKKECGFLCLVFVSPSHLSQTALTILINYILWTNREIC